MSASEVERIEASADNILRSVQSQQQRVDKLLAVLNRLHDFISASNDWRPDSKLARDVRQVLDR